MTPLSEDSADGGAPGDVVPMVVLGGWLGSGKTTLLNRLLESASGERIAVIVNDVGEINIDAELIESRDATTVELTDGCVCCSIGDSLAVTLYELFSRTPTPDRIVIEASGVADPVKVGRYGNREVLRLDAIVTTVDASDVLRVERHPSYGEMVRHQIRAADLVVVTKTDLISSADIDHVVDWCCDLADGPVVVAGSSPSWAAALLGDVSRVAEATRPHDHEVGHQPPIDVATEVWEPAPGMTVDEIGTRLMATTGLLRAKGFVEDPSTGMVHLVSVAGSRFETIPAPDVAPTGVVLISEV